jgi:phospholipase A-2-activating protein
MGQLESSSISIDQIIYLLTFDMSTKPFKLSATLVGHSQDVKSVKFLSSSLILSCARDTTARVWRRTDGKWSEELVYQNSNPGFLNAIDAITIKKKGLIFYHSVSGCLRRLCGSC